MIIKKRRDLGDLDAATDEKFTEHFVESQDLKNILTNESDVIYGSKGVGKTALRRALSELNHASYYATKTIDLDEISFTQFHSALNNLKSATQTEVATLARITWRNVLAVYCLEVFASSLSNDDILKIKIDQIISLENLDGVDSKHRLLNQVENFLKRITNIGCDETALLGLSEQQIRVINNFPSNPEVKPVLEKCSEEIVKSGKKILICIDGFDSIVDHTPESRKEIFAGLIDAIHKCSKDLLFSKAFCFKAFLPKELAEDADVVWDSDKHVLNRRHLKWSEDGFRRLTHKRLLPYAKTKSANFSHVWNDFFPDKIKNPEHGIEENTYHYILRHTLYRPRQLLTHLQKLFNDWDQTTNSFKIDPSFIPQSIANTNYLMSENFINQLEFSMPGIWAFMQSWHASENVISANEFQDKINRFFDCDNSFETTDIFNKMFGFGIFGIVRRKNEGRGIKVFYGYVSDRYPRIIHSMLKETDCVAISPMLNEFCGCKPFKKGPIFPVDSL